MRRIGSFILRRYHVNKLISQCYRSAHIFGQAGLEPCRMSFGIAFDQSDIYKAEMRCNLSSLLKLLPPKGSKEQTYLVRSIT